jgi:hypothetical protein
MQRPMHIATGAKWRRAADGAGRWMRFVTERDF